MSSRRRGGLRSMAKSGSATGCSSWPAARSALFRRMTKLNRFRSCLRNRSSLMSSMLPGSSGVVDTGVGALAATKARICEPRWKWRRMSQLASGETKRFMLKASSRCSSLEWAQLRGSSTLRIWMRTMLVRASGRRKGSRYWREPLLQSRSQAALTSSGSGVLWSRYSARQGLGSRSSWGGSMKSGGCISAPRAGHARTASGTAPPCGARCARWPAPPCPRCRLCRPAPSPSARP